MGPLVVPARLDARLFLAFAASLAVFAPFAISAPLQAQPTDAPRDGLAPLPDLVAYVTDTTGTLEPATAAALEERLARLEDDKGAQFVIVLTDSTAPEAIEEYSLRLAENEGIGRAGVDDGVLLLVAVEDRRLRIEVGYGLEGVIPDATANRIIEESIVPHFKQGDFGAGVTAGAERIEAFIREEELPERWETYALQRERRNEWSKATFGMPLWKLMDYFIYAMLVLAGLPGVVLVLMKKNLWGFFYPLVVYFPPLFILGFWEYYLREASFAAAFWPVAFMFLYIFRNSDWSGSYSGGSSSSSSWRSSSYSSSSSSSSSRSSYSSSSSSSGFSGGGGSFGGGGASGSW